MKKGKCNNHIYISNSNTDCAKTLLSTLNAYLQVSCGWGVDLILHRSSKLPLQMKMKIGTFGSILNSWEAAIKLESF